MAVERVVIPDLLLAVLPVCLPVEALRDRFEQLADLEGLERDGPLVPERPVG